MPAMKKLLLLLIIVAGAAQLKAQAIIKPFDKNLFEVKPIDSTLFKNFSTKPNSELLALKPEKLSDNNLFLLSPGANIDNMPIIKLSGNIDCMPILKVSGDIDRMPVKKIINVPSDKLKKVIP
jgi:hypothetical protein